MEGRSVSPFTSVLQIWTNRGVTRNGHLICQYRSSENASYIPVRRAGQVGYQMSIFEETSGA